MIPAGKKIHLLKNRINSLRSQIKQKEIELEKCMNDLKKLKG